MRIFCVNGLIFINYKPLTFPYFSPIISSFSFFSSNYSFRAHIAFLKNVMNRDYSLFNHKHPNEFQKINIMAETLDFSMN